jgi:hypothetical protein
MQSITVTINQSVMARQRQTPLNVRFAEEVDILSFRGNFEKAVSYKLQTKRDQVQQQSCEETSQESMKWNESLTIDEVFKPGSCTSIGSSGGSSNNRGRWNKKFGKNGSSGTTNGGGSSSNSNHIAQWSKRNGKTGSGGSSVGCSGGASTSNSNSNRGQWTKKFKLLNFSSEKIDKTVHE